MTKHFLGRMVTLFALALAALSAGHGTANAGTNVACFKVLNASPDAPNLDVYVNRTRVAANLAYTKFSARRWCYPATEALVRAFVAGSNPNATTPAVQDMVALAIDQEYIIAIANYFQPQQPQQPPPLEIVALQLPGAPPSGQFSLTVFNLAPNVPAVNLVKIPENAVLLDNVVFPSAKTGNFNPGTYDLILIQPGSSTPLFPLGTNNFSAGQKQSVYVFAAPGMSAARALAPTGADAAAPVTAFILRER